MSSLERIKGGIPPLDTGPLSNSMDAIKMKLTKLSLTSNSSDDHISDCDSGHASDILSPLPSDGSHIWGTKFILALDTQGRGTKDVGDPHGVAFKPNGDLVIADNGNNRLHIVTTNGKVYRRIGKNQAAVVTHKDGSLSGSGRNADISPLGVVVTLEGYIAFTDSKQKCVRVCTEEGDIVDEWGKGYFKEPYGITQAKNGQFIVSDIGSHTVSIHESDGTFVSSFAGRGRNGDKVNAPYFLAVGHNDDTIIVSDCYNHAVKVYNFDGQLVRTIGTHETMKMPYGVAVDPLGNIAICEKDNNNACLYSPEGNYIQSIFKKDDEIVQPWGLAINPGTGHIAITRRVASYPMRKPPPEACLLQLLSCEDAEHLESPLVVIPESPDEGMASLANSTSFTFQHK